MQPDPTGGLPWLENVAMMPTSYALSEKGKPG
jgi:hypothetical protein